MSQLCEKMQRILTLRMQSDKNYLLILVQTIVFSNIHLPPPFCMEIQYCGSGGRQVTLLCRLLKWRA